MFRVVLEEYRALCQLRKRLEAEVVTRLANQPRFRRASGYRENESWSVTDALTPYSLPFLRQG
jgi:hypothetical protein